MAIFSQQGPKLPTREQPESPDEVAPSRCPPTVTRPSSAGLTTTGASGRRGSTRAAAVSGPSKEANWSARARLEPPGKASPSRCPPTAPLPSLADHTTTEDVGAAWVYMRSGGVWTQQGNKLVGTGSVGAAVKAAPSRCPPMAIRPSWAGRATTGDDGAAWVYMRSGGVWTQQGKADRHGIDWSRP